MVRILISVGAISLMGVPGVSNNPCATLKVVLEGKSDQEIIDLLSRGPQETPSAVINFPSVVVREMKSYVGRGASNPNDYFAKKKCLEYAVALKEPTKQRIVQ